jgi:antitoxin (DNA-binding transcriptional repressor) of toxin-antitoxin stability system
MRMSKHSLRISEAEAANDFASLMARVRAGVEVVIERDAEAVAVLRPAAPNVRLLSESVRLAKERGSTATLDDGFGRDLEHVITSHDDPLNPPSWD